MLAVEIVLLWSCKSKRIIKYNEIRQECRHFITKFRIEMYMSGIY